MRFHCRGAHQRGPFQPKSFRVFNLVIALVVICLVAASSPFAQSDKRVPKTKIKKTKTAQPQLIVLLTVDQMRADFFTRYESDYSGGLKKLWNGGAVFLDAEHHHAMTATAPGHATIATGAFPSRSGIVGNNFYDRALGKTVYSARDTFPAIAHPWADSASPRRQQVDGLGDFLKQHDSKAKAFGLSLKDRSAIFTAGRKANAAFWFDEKTGHFVTSTYYGKSVPSWVDRFNRSAIRNRWRNTPWEPIAAASVYNESRVDSFFYENDGKQVAFPHREHIAADSSDYFDALTVTPFGDELTLIFAESLLVAEGLGKDRSVDLLSVSLSAADIAGHAYGPYSKEMQDYYLRLDGYLDSFMQFLDRQVGSGNWVMAFTADHGVLPVPEYLPALNLPGRRVLADQFRANIKNLIATDPELLRLGVADMPIKSSGQDIVLDSAWLAKKGSSIGAVQNIVAAAVARSIEVDVTFTRSELMSKMMLSKPHAELVRNSFDPRLAADIIVITKPGILVSSSGQGTSHLTPHDYDRKVPILFYGGSVCASRISSPAYTVDIVPTLVEMFSLRTTATFDGRSRLAEIRCR